MTRAEIHDEALKHWELNSYKGIVKAVTGIGKSSIFFKSLYILREKENLEFEEVWYYRETTLGEATLQQECKEFEAREGKNPCKDFNIIFKTYQSKVTGTPTYVCLDECDFPGDKLLAPIRNLGAKYVLALSATVSPIKLTLYKGFLNLIYNYSRKQASNEGHVNEVETYVIKHKLDSTVKYLKVWKSSKFDVSEKDYWTTKREYTNWAEANPAIVKVIRQFQLPSFLHNLNSKIEVFKEISKNIQGKCLVFGKTHSFLEQLGIPHLRGVNDKELIADFNEGKSQFLAATPTKLGRGINLDSVENIFLLSSGKSFTQFSQMLGRSRKKEGVVTKLWIIVTEGTYEELWIKEVNKDRDGWRIVEHFDINIQS